MAGAAAVALENIFVDFGNGRAKLADVADEFLCVEDLFELLAGDAKVQDGTVAVEHGRDGGIDDKLDAHLLCQPPHGFCVGDVLLHQHVA